MADISIYAWNRDHRLTHAELEDLIKAKLQVARIMKGHSSKSALYWYEKLEEVRSMQKKYGWNRH